MFRGESPRTASAAMFRTGGACFIVGSLAVLAFRLAHGDLPAADAEAALVFISEHPAYAGIHLGTICGVLIWVGGAVTLSATFEHRRAVLLGRLGAAGVLIGAAVFAIEHSIDGVAGQALAERLAEAAPAVRAELVLSARTAFTMLRGPSLIAIIALWGLPLVLFGRAVTVEGYAAWLGWAGVVSGGLVTLSAAALFLREDLFPGVLVYGLLATVLVQLWGLALGIRMWRQAHSAPPPPS